MEQRPRESRKLQIKSFEVRTVCRSTQIVVITCLYLCLCDAWSLFKVQKIPKVILEMTQIFKSFKRPLLFSASRLYVINSLRALPLPPSLSLLWHKSRGWISEFKSNECSGNWSLVFLFPNVLRLSLSWAAHDPTSTLDNNCKVWWR